MDLSGDETKLIKEIPIGKSVVWSVVGDKNILWDFRKEQVQIFDMNLEPAKHPLADIINQNKGKIRFTWIHAHPTSPFAILSGGKYGSIFTNWGTDRETTPRLLIPGGTQFSFSPDGKWVTYKDDSFGLNDARTFLIPISEKYPHYLGSPIQILDYYFNDDNFAWTTNPTSFVGSSGEKIYRWDLENRNYPGKDKMSFHDYIVQQDLEKMAKEKKTEARK